MIHHPHMLMRNRHARRPGTSSRRGFTLIEASLTMVIIGVGVVAMLQLLAAGTVANIDGSELTTGVNFARSVRELTLKRTFAEVRAMDGASYTPPIDSRGVAVAGFDGWTQTVDVQSVDRDRITLDIVDPNPQAVRVTVSITHNGQQVCNLIWYRFRPVP